ncbi:MAG: hypothetical protein HY934_04565 [Candidatus Firestonebacteria bacterium]|nr:hypothetical protein [Candidatus Firestonebacteria bacterium]
MALKEIIKKIKKEYDNKIIEIESACNEKLLEIETNTQAEIQRLKEDIRKKTDEEISNIKKTARLEAYLYRKNILLKEKQDIVEEVFNEAKKRIINMDKNAYRALFKQKIFANLSSLGQGEIIIFISFYDKDRINEEFILSLNSEIKHKNIFLKLSPEYKKISGGFILKKGELEINESWDMIFTLLKKELEIDVSRILFRTD